MKYGKLGRRKRFSFSSPKSSDRLLFNGYRGSFPGNDADQSPPTSAEMKNEWIYTSAPPIQLHGVEKNFYFLLECNVVHPGADAVSISGVG
jgi:hypothetical protein